MKCSILLVALLLMAFTSNTSSRTGIVADSREYDISWVDDSCVVHRITGVVVIYRKDGKSIRLIEEGKP